MKVFSRENHINKGTGHRRRPVTDKDQKKREKKKEKRLVQGCLLQPHLSKVSILGDVGIL